MAAIVYKTHSIRARRVRACGRASGVSKRQSSSSALAALAMAWRLLTRRMEAF